MNNNPLVDMFTVSLFVGQMLNLRNGFLTRAVIKIRRLIHLLKIKNPKTQDQWKKKLSSVTNQGSILKNTDHERICRWSYGQAVHHG